MSSTILEWISFESFGRHLSDEEAESLCIQIGRILSSSSVQVLAIDICNLSARCFLNLASGLRRNSDSKLQSLILEWALEDSSAVKHVADMMNSATRLETLSLGHLGAMEEEYVGILSRALIHRSSLKELKLEEVEWGAALLLQALAGDHGNQSIERLYLTEVDGLGGCLREVLTSNPSLKEVRLSSVEMSPEEWHQLGEVIRDKDRATNIEINFHWGDEWESIEALVCAASSEVKDPTVKLELCPSNENECMLSLNLLGRVLRGEIKSLKSISILASLDTSGTNQDRPQCILSMNGKTGETSVLKQLQLFVPSYDLWNDLLLCLRGNTSLIHLDLSGFYLEEEAFRDLMGLLQVNLTLQEINVSGTSWASDGKAALIEEALKQNQKRQDSITSNPYEDSLRQKLGWKEMGAIVEDSRHGSEALGKK
ncbi:hypothetical protein AXG93_3069s1000 [Marchantia polymorpha subsp. ruderalis]|uniref:FBD domain-containing protein n=1 Tax=Marchantia polymorpha subsp. ruderalis TaxID=1480154 RepID=A0A176W1I3_MARPO|nr:hypothetical protein AXG93_3069s1000 [Marchantia polymorpha subsp. ruderalis]